MANLYIMGANSTKNLKLLISLALINSMTSSSKYVFHLSFLLLVVILLPYVAAVGGRGPRLLEQWRPDGLVNTKQPAKTGTTWAVLVAGSNEFYNYRHQADVCHAYQLLKRGGLKDENIIVFMYDDIAKNPENPRHGIIINHPNGSDVYAGVPKDYTNHHATVDNLYAVLLANKTGLSGGSGKVLDTKPEDRIFIYYTDHGGPGALGMPMGPFLYADDFIKVLKKKHAVGAYKEMVIYVEACESGSIFEGLLPENLNIYVTTASNAKESSYATYCPDSHPPAPSEYDVCLGDLYSVAWMEDSDARNIKDETLKQQFKNVKMRIINNHDEPIAHVKEYGMKSLNSQSIALYQGFSVRNSSNLNSGVMTGVDQRDADLIYLQRKYHKLADGSEENEQLGAQINDITNHRSHLADGINKIGSILFGSLNASRLLGSIRSEGSPIVDDWGCLKSMVRTFETHCGSLTQYGMKHMRAFANMCNNGVTTSAMEEASKEACKGYNLGQWNPTIAGYSA